MISPSRVVDARHRGWYLTGSGLYETAYARVQGGFAPELEPRDYEKLDATRGPLRPVVAPSEESTKELDDALKSAGRLAAGSLLVALARIQWYIAVKPGQSEEIGSLVAGREGSWEAESMRQAIWGLGVDMKDKPKRYDEAAAERLEAVIYGWINGEDYTEVAENLAYHFSKAADSRGGWSGVADRMLLPGSKITYSQDAINNLVGWLMSRSEHHGV